MNTKSTLAISAFTIALLLGTTGNPLIAQQQPYPDQKIDQLQNTIDQMQAELQRLRSERSSSGNPLPQSRQRPSSNQLPPPPAGQTFQSMPTNPADQAPSLGPVPPSAPGQGLAPTSGLVLETPSIVPPTRIIERPEPLIPSQRTGLVEWVPVYRTPYYRPPYSSCSSEFGCPYRTGSYRAPYAEYEYSELQRLR